MVLSKLIQCLYEQRKIDEEIGKEKSDKELENDLGVSNILDVANYLLAHQTNARFGLNCYFYEYQKRCNHKSKPEKGPINIFNHCVGVIHQYLK